MTTVASGASRSLMCPFFVYCWKVCVFKVLHSYLHVTYIGKGAEGAQKAHNNQAQYKQLPSVRQVTRVFIHHSSNDSLQSSKLRQRRERAMSMSVITSLSSGIIWYIQVIGKSPSFDETLQPKFCHTVLSSPSVIIITKKMMAKNVDPVMLAMASG